MKRLQRSVRSKSWRPLALGVALGALIAPRLAPASTLASPCIGDCNGDGEVTVDELVTGVNIALGSRPLVACAAFDFNHDGMVTVEELIAGVSAVIEGCASATMTPTATHTVSASPTQTSTASETATAIPTATSTLALAASPTPTSPPTPTDTQQPTATQPPPTPTDTAPPVATPTDTTVPSASATPTAPPATNTQAPTATEAVPTPTDTASPAATPTDTTVPSASATPSEPPPATDTPAPTTTEVVPTPTDTAAPAATPTDTALSSASATPTEAPPATDTAAPSATEAAATPTDTASPTATASETALPDASATPTDTVPPPSTATPTPTAGSAPSGLAVVIDGGTIHLTWTNPDPSSGNTQVRVLRKIGSAPSGPDDADAIDLFSGAAAQTVDDLTALLPDVPNAPRTYYYAVYGCIPGGACETVGSIRSINPTLVEVLHAGGYTIYWPHATAPICQDCLALGPAATTMSADWWRSCDPHCPVSEMECDSANMAVARQLNAKGRLESIEIGNQFGMRGIPVGRVLSSEFCRSVMTAQYMNFGPAIEQRPEITFFVYDEVNRCDNSMALLAEAPTPGTNTAIIGHADFSGVCPILGDLAPAEAAVYKPNGTGSADFVTRVLAAEWATLATKAAMEIVAP